MTTTTTTTKTTTTDERLERALRGLREALERAKRTRALCETLDDDDEFAADLRHTTELEAEDLRWRLRAVIYLTLTRDVSETAVALLAHKYLDGTFLEPADATQVAFDYATVLMGLGADERDQYMNEDAADKFGAIRDAYFNAVFVDGFEDEMFAADEMFDEALEDLRSLFREPKADDDADDEADDEADDTVWEDFVALLENAGLSVLGSYSDSIAEAEITGCTNAGVEQAHDFCCTHADDPGALAASFRELAENFDAEAAGDEDLTDLEEYAADLEKVADDVDAWAETYDEAPFDINDDEVADDPDENLADLLRIGNMTVDDLIARIPEGKGDKISIASALISGGLVCDPNGRIYIEAFEPTEATSNYPDRISDALTQYRMHIMDKAFEIIDFAADNRTVQLSPDLYATILGFSEIPEDIWVPYVQAWEDDPFAKRWERHERRWQSICGAYDELYDAYNAGRPTFEATDEDEDPAEPHLDAYLVATGGWLLVEDDCTEDRWYVNALDVFGFDDARTIADAGDMWTSSHYRVRRHEASKTAA